MKFKKPPHPRNRDEEERKVGIELEFSGMDIENMVQIVQDIYGGTHQKENRFLHRIKNTPYGHFKIKVDASILTDKSYESYFEKFGINIGDIVDKTSLEQVLEKIATTVVPVEIAAPPVKLSELPEIDKLREALYLNKAQGTKASLVYAFGLHINPEAPSLELPAVLMTLKAFMLLYPWIFKQSEIDFSRQLTPFINEFPDEYALLILDPDYDTSQAEVIPDYLQHNSTRNRPLDMLPLFSYLKPDIPASLGDELIEPRPAYHYRLPNSLIDDPDWTLAGEWNRWILVEQLAEMPDMIDSLGGEYIELFKETTFSFKNKWTDRMNQWLKTENLLDR